MGKGALYRALGVVVTPHSISSLRVQLNRSSVQTQKHEVARRAAEMAPAKLIGLRTTAHIEAIRGVFAGIGIPERVYLLSAIFIIAHRALLTGTSTSNF